MTHRKEGGVSAALTCIHDCRGTGFLKIIGYLPGFFREFAQRDVLGDAEEIGFRRVYLPCTLGGVCSQIRFPARCLQCHAGWKNNVRRISSGMSDVPRRPLKPKIVCSPYPFARAQTFPLAYRTSKHVISAMKFALAHEKFYNSMIKPHGATMRQHGARHKCDGRR